MAINNEDVKLFESQRLTDEEDGGGRVTGSEVIDGNINNLYRDISRIDRTIGDVALRKAFVGVSTDNNDAYLGSHIILTEAPKDDNVSVLLFNTDDQTDVREDARDRIEAFVVSGTRAEWELWGDHLEGQRSLTALQQFQHRIPEIGEVYRLVDTHNDNAEQYVRVTDVEFETETFYLTVGEEVDSYDRRKIIMGISAPLKTLFHGGEPNGVSWKGDRSDIFSTQVADTSRYYGIQPLSANVSQGALTLKVKSVYSPLVPSAKIETPLLDQYGGYTSKMMVATANDERTLSCSFVQVQNNQSRSFLQRGALPGSITLTLDGGTYRDDGTGNFIHNSGSNNYDKLTVDYERGEINVWRSSSYFTGSCSATYKPATGITGASISGSIEVSIQNRGFNYTLSLSEAKPRPGTLVVSYIALGKWQDVRDTGDGVLDGSGSGNVLFDSGSVALTFDAMPDPDSAIVYSYVAQNDDEVTIRTGSVATDKIAFRHTVEKPGINPGSLAVTYVHGGQNKTLSDQGNGLLTGDGNGAIHYAPGELSFSLDYLPDDDTEIELQYEEGEAAGGEVSVTVDGQGVMSGTIPGAPLLPGSVQLQFLVQQQSNIPSASQGSDFTTYETTRNVSKSISDDTSGGWRDVTGAIDYQTGSFTILALNDYDYTEFVNRADTIGGKVYRYRVETTTTTKTQVFSGSSITAIAQANHLTHQPYTETISSPELSIDLLPLVEAPLLPGSVIFTWNGETYFDREGDVFKEISTETNAGLQVGNIDYSGGVVTLANYPSGNVQTASIIAAATIGAGFTTDAISFRTPGSPLRVGSLQITAIRADTADIITATADFNGLFDTSEVQGMINTTIGWAEIQFVDGSSPDKKPINIIPQTVRYNTVVENNLPLDAELDWP